tara:strand:- start:65 stop:475 length:411 start_codon:yes stop_codon:yes gene_type:complete
MNKEQYLQQLESQNGYCECPDLQDLFATRRHAEALEAKCDVFSRNVDLENPQEEDRQILLDYREAAEQLEKSTREYHSSLTDTIRIGKSKMILHDTKRFIPHTEISYEHASSLLEQGDPVITIHCNTCDQQIDTAR